MIRVPASAFPMGSDHESRAEKPMHRVVLGKAFFIDALEVTAGAYAACVGKGACTPPVVHFGAGSDPLQKGCNTGPERARHPANCVDQLQAGRYCAFVGKRLPTEAEWELAARGTDGRDYPWGDAPPKSCTQGILRGLTGGCEKKLDTFEVGLTPDGKSPFGAWDMSGNVWEWVADGFADYPASEVKDPFVAPGTGPDAKGVLRGGSFDYATTVAKTSSRLGLLRTAGHVSTGFRCAKD
jgi:formylglycine-generating enzyme required for sulfatase activity